MRELTAYPTTTVGHVSGVVVPDEGPDPILLLGAGASAMSGIPTAGQLAAMAAKWAYCERHNCSHQDPRITRSDWLPWLQGQPWFDSAAPMASMYPQVVEQLLRPRENRREFFLDALRRRGPLSSGWGALAGLAAERRLRTILTTNFDDLVAAALHARPEIRHIELIERPDVDLRRLSTDPTYPQVVYLHGSVVHYCDRNLEEETVALDPLLRGALRPLLRDHSLIVVGYRGGERSVMVDLLLDGADEANGYSRGIYWCSLGEEPEDLDPLVRRLADRAGANFQLVPIDGFDDAMKEWAHAGKERAPSPRIIPRTPPPVRDLQPSSVPLEDLDWELIADQLGEYAGRLGQGMPAGSDREALTAMLVELDLATEVDGVIVPTKAGELLFSRAEPTSAELRHEGAVLPVRGNLLVVLRHLTEMVEEINAPFRLKGPVSQDVRRHDQGAIKEILVNSMAHRDHDRDEPVRVTFDGRDLTVATPGGLVPPLTGERLGEPGAKAYRNPVVADLLYGTGMMDKAGSGLADVRRWSRDIGGEAEFGPTADGRGFVVVLKGRAEFPDSRTGTADPLNVEHFLSNMLAVRIEARSVSVAHSPARAREIYERHDGWRLPPFAIHGEELWSFSDLEDRANPLSEETRGAVRRVEIAELEGDVDGRRRLVELLNRTFIGHAESLGLVVDRARQRIWFPSDEGQERRITYQGRVKRSTRTVTKPISREDGRARRWEHESLSWSFRRYGDSWVVHVVPGWVFTDDGRWAMMRGPKVSKFAVRRAARDYNAQVSHHLHFWLWVLTRGQDLAPIDPLAEAVSIEGRLLSYDVIGAPVPTGPPTLMREDDAAVESEEIAADDDERKAA
ncbi:MAG: SIR2 family protein [Solirubrobacterales bacterium]